jgi:hypothetical protein
MPVTWHLDEGLAQLSKEIKKEYPGTTIYSIADSAHSQNPDVSQHARDKGGKLPGDDKGEVDAIDVMPNPKAGLDMDELDEVIAEGLRRNKDKRLLYVIVKDKIFSSVVEPWRWRKYKGKYHNHLHVSVNDLFDSNESDWQWEKLAKQWEFKTVEGARLPEKLLYGYDDDSYDGYNHVARAQALLNFQEKAKPLDLDGVYGANTVAKVKRVFGGDGKVITFDQLRKLHGI